MRKAALRIAGGSVAAVAAAYGVWVAATWLRYGRPGRAKIDEADPLLDGFMPEYDVAERHSISVEAPAGITFAAACETDFADSAIVRALFRCRELLLRARARPASPSRGLRFTAKAMGWGILAELPGREIVMGAATQPWVANVVFRPVEPGEFASFQDPEYIKIAWTLRADPVAAATSIFRTETRAVACGPVARRKFRRYWAFLSPGVILIRLAMLGLVRREAERRTRADSA